MQHAACACLFLVLHAVHKCTEIVNAISDCNANLHFCKMKANLISFNFNHFFHSIHHKKVAMLIIIANVAWRNKCQPNHIPYQITKLARTFIQRQIFWVYFTCAVISLFIIAFLRRLRFPKIAQHVTWTLNTNLTMLIFFTFLTSFDIDYLN